VALVILISFVIFNANGMSGAIADVGAMFGAGGLPLWSSETGYYLSGYAIVLACAAFGATPVLKNAVLKLKENKIANRIINVLEPVFVLAVLLLVTAYFVDGSFSAFLYFRF
jgi:alginate O-acetyltransferase complex protein AlgI